VSKRLALFDFDGTLTRKDSLIDFIRFSVPPWRLLLNAPLLGFLFLLHKMSLLSAHRLKERVLTAFYENLPIDAFNKLCALYASKRLPDLIRTDAIQCLREHLANHDTILVVSASLENWIDPWCSAYGVGCIATRVETRNGRLTGKIDGLNCKGEEKVRRLREILDLTAFSDIAAYGDTAGDRAMLNLSTRPFYRIFNG
jgi:phosphatidylglycerophosphatase C